MRFGQAKSISRLIVHGFGLVLVPLIAALGYAAVHVDRLAEQSQHAVYQAVQAIENSRMLLEYLTSMERNARQYLILEDASLLEAYAQTHELFRKAASALSHLPLGDAPRRSVTQVVALESRLFEDLRRGNLKGQGQRTVTERFIAAIDVAQAVLSGSNSLIDQEVQVLRQQAAHARQVLFWLAVSLIPLSVLMAGLYTVLISKPVRQVDHAIRQLGDGRFDTVIAVDGPQDLQYLGQRLDWLRTRLTELEQQKTRFLRHISHELKTPLTAIREGVALLGDHVMGRLNTEQEEIVRILRTTTGQLQRLIEDLLSFSTAHLDQPYLHRSRVDARVVVQKALESHKTAMLAKGLRLEARLQPIELHADADKLQTVVDNLLSNAVKFSRPQGRLVCKLQRNDDSVVLDVIDEGVGIAADEREKIFEAFYQGRAPVEGYVKGSGLGLAIAREYVTAHGGSVEVVASKGPGAHLRVRLPLGERAVGT